jgi:hypothetical protein
MAPDGAEVMHKRLRKPPKTRPFSRSEVSAEFGAFFGRLGLAQSFLHIKPANR